VGGATFLPPCLLCRCQKAVFDVCSQLHFWWRCVYTVDCKQTQVNTQRRDRQVVSEWLVEWLIGWFLRPSNLRGFIASNEVQKTDVRCIAYRVRLIVSQIYEYPAENRSVCCECFVLSYRGLCDGPIPRPEESYRWLSLRVLCVVRDLYDGPIPLPEESYRLLSLRVLCLVRYRSLRRADPSSRGALWMSVCLLWVLCFVR
jgi:hypothetical protein